MTEPNIERTETCKFLSYRDDKQTNVTEVELELIAKLVPHLWNEDEDKISFAVICEGKPGLLLEVHYPDGVVPGSLEASLLLKLADEFPPVKFWFTQGDHTPNSVTRGKLSYRSKSPNSTTPTKSTSASNFRGFGHCP